MVRESIGHRALNRAYLSRQLLVERATLPVLDAIEHLVALQAQAPKPPYYALWSRLTGFRAEELARSLRDRATVRMALMRGTVHWVSARDCRWMRPLTQPIYERTLRSTDRRPLAGLDPRDVADVGVELLAQGPLSVRRLGAALRERWPDRDADTLSRVVRYLVPVVQVPPRAIWGSSGEPVLDLAEHWIGDSLVSAADADPRTLVLRYLAAYGPASVRDIQTFSGLTRLAEVVDDLRPRLRTFAGESGRELFDLPDAPRPDADRPVPVRFLAEYDNAILAHDDRGRIISDANRKRIATRNGQVPGTFLVDGTVHGTWKVRVDKNQATLTLTPFERLGPAARAELQEEGLRLLAFVAGDSETSDDSGAAGSVRFEPVAD